MSYSLNQLYEVTGISKQAVHQYAGRQVALNTKVTELVKQADAIRKEHPGCGVEKIYHMFKPDCMGRDKFIDVFMRLGFRLQRKKNYRRTTRSTDQYYPNRIQGLEVSQKSVVWQSDITYIQVGSKFYYATFIIDVYTKEIVGYQVSNHMRAELNVQALNKALRHHPAPRIHHSDRGSQYMSHKYTEILNDNGVKISMGLTAQDNAYAERINRTIKEEYLQYKEIQTLQQLKRAVRRAVKNYNKKRPHKSLNYLTPSEYVKVTKALNQSQTPKISIFNPQKTVNHI